MPKSATYMDKRADIADWLKDMFEDNITADIFWSGAAADFLKYMKAKGWKVVAES